MKKKLHIALSIVAFLFATMSYAQTPEGINYQAVARDNSGTLITNKSITVKTVILSGAGGSKKVYEETHVVSTNTYGHFNLVVGQGSTNDDFSSIDWSGDIHHLKVEIDQGSGFAVMGTVQLQSVPYALHAKTAENVTNISISTSDIDDIDGSGAANGQTLKWDGTKWVPGADKEGQTLTAGTGLDITSGTITVKSADAIWNANKLNGNDVSSIAPQMNNTLRWNGSSWAPSTALSAGTGLDLTNSVFSAKSGDAIWNANKFNGYDFPSGVPSANQVMQFDGTAWKYATLAGGGSSKTYWDSISGDIIYNGGGKVVIGRNSSINNTRLTVYDSIVSTSAGIYQNFESLMYGGSSTSGQYYANRSVLIGNGGARQYGNFQLVTGTCATNGRGMGMWSICNATGGGVSTGIQADAAGASTFNIGVLGSAQSASTSASGTNYGVYAVADSGNTNYAGYFVGDVTYTGTLSKASDAKLKYNVNDLTNATDIIKGLNAKTYLYKQEGEAGYLNLPTTKQYGFIAQDVEKVLPTLVNTQVQMKSTDENVDGQVEYKAVNYVSLIPVLTQAIKEQQETIEALQKRIEELEKQ